MRNFKFKKRHVIYAAIVASIFYYIALTVPFGSYDYLPEEAGQPGKYSYDVPLDPESPWPKFRANEIQTGRSPVVPNIDPSNKPWTFQTGKGIFSSPVVDGDGIVYIGSADQKFYAIDKTGKLKWHVQTGEIIDSSALLDDKGRIFFGSGDGHLYALNKKDGQILWKHKAHSVEEVEKEFGVKTYNVNWYEGNVSMLKDGTLLAPNDNYLVYAVNREDGKRKTQFVSNEMVWSVPAVNTRTGRIFFGTCFMAMKNIFSFDGNTGKPAWTTGTLGTIAASVLLTSNKTNGVLIVGGFDGYVRAIAQDSGKELWKTGVRDHIYSSPAQLSDGTIIQPSADGSVYAIEPKTGTIKWAFDTLEPIRSSPAVDANNTIYVGSGEGRLFAINPDGTLRWAYKLIDDDRNDLNSSPALGKDGVFVAGESGGVFFVPYDYPLSGAGKNDSKSTLGPKEDLPEEGNYMIFTTRFGALYLNPPKEIDANEPLTFSLFIRKQGDTVLSAIDRDNLKVTVSGNPKMMVNVSANRRFVILSPQETWMGPEGGELKVNLKGTYTGDMSRFGLKFYGGSHGGNFDETFIFTVPPRKGGPIPYKIPIQIGDPSSTFEISRLAAPNPTMLPSWNQIGFDSLHYIAGAVEGKSSKALLWVIGGKLEKGETIVDPNLEVRYPLTLDYDSGLITLINYDGFKINFIGSWDMPFGSYRIASKADTGTGAILKRPAFTAIAMGDEIEFYGKFLKMMGMTEFDTGKMAVYGGTNLSLFGKGYADKPEGIGETKFTINSTSASVEITGGKLKKDDHVYSLLLVDEEKGVSFPLYYTKRTKVDTDAGGIVNKVTVSFDKGEVKGKVKAYYMVDTYPSAKADLSL